jgi:UDP-glucuronate decarboxylase
MEHMFEESILYNNTDFSQSKIIVFGGTGFIGNHLCRKLVKEGHNVICVDNNYSGSTSNICDLSNNPKFQYINHNIINPIYIKGNISHIYNLACPASPKAYQRDPLFTIKTCTVGTINVLEFAREKGAKVLLTSTSEVYGDPMISPQTEEYWGNVNPIGIRSCYDEGKRIAETIMMEYKKKYGLPICIARIFNTYGPNMDKDDGRVVSNFINQCLEDKDITIFGNGSQTRSFCYVDDTVDGLMRLMNNTITSGPINIGNPHEITVKELANIILSMIEDIQKKKRSTIKYCDLPSDDPTRRCPDISKAIAILEWKPKIELKEGLLRTIEYFSITLK